MECDDPNCPGCKMERLLNELKAQEMPPQMIIMLFFDYMREVFAEEAIFEYNMESVRRSLH